MHHWKFAIYFPSSFNWLWKMCKAPLFISCLCSKASTVCAASPTVTESNNDPNDYSKRQRMVLFSKVNNWSFLVFLSYNYSQHTVQVCRTTLCLCLLLVVVTRWGRRDRAEQRVWLSGWRRTRTEWRRRLKQDKVNILLLIMPFLAMLVTN